MNNTTEVNSVNAHKIIVTASYEEKQQGLVDSMLCSWSDLSTYNDVYSNLDKLTEEQQVDVAQNIIYRRIDQAGV
ncbi:hypothetical protein KA025_01670 [Candidatus Saccharibacteria bacterium]|nr:hypothetical protein [Candidatus Saccharibacteria bacterium]